MRVFLIVFQCFWISCLASTVGAQVLLLGLEWQSEFLYDINPATGSASNLRVIDTESLTGIAMSSDGTLYALSTFLGTEPNALYTIDPVTGTSQLVGPTGLEDLREGGLAFDPLSGLLYGVQNFEGKTVELFTMDLKTGSATVVGAVPLPVDLSAMAFDSAGDLFLLDTQTESLLKVDVATAAVLSSVPLSRLLGTVAGMDFHPCTGVQFVSDGAAGGSRNLYKLAGDGTLTPIGPTGLGPGLAGLTFMLTLQWGELQDLTASGGASEDHFGNAVALYGNTAVVGAYGVDDTTGAVVVLNRTGGEAGSWGESKTLTASDGVLDDAFGFSVALSGDTLAVGAPGANGNLGAVVVYDRHQGGTDNWGEVKKLTVAVGVTNLFGHAVAIDGDTLIVGSPGDLSATGAVYVFQRDESGANQWGQVQKVTAPEPTIADFFGEAVAIDGDTLVVGAFGTDSFVGAAYVFERNQGGADNWGEVRQLTASDGSPNDTLGESVSISVDTLVVGAPGNAGSAGAAYIFERNLGGDNTWGERLKLAASDGAALDLFGTSIAISGGTVAVGAILQDGAAQNAGAAYVFARDTGGADAWGEIERLTASGAAADDQLGTSVALSGKTLVVGAALRDGVGSDSGAAFVFSSLTDCIAYAQLFDDGFETGDTSAWSDVVENPSLISSSTQGGGSGQ